MREIRIDPESLTLGFLEDIQEAQETGKWRPMIDAVRSLLGLSRDEARALTVADFKAIALQVAEAAKESADNPNGSAPRST